MNAQDLAVCIVTAAASIVMVIGSEGVIEWTRTQRNRRKISQTMLKLAQQAQEHAIKENK